MAAPPTDSRPGLVTLFDQQSRLAAEVGSPLCAQVCAAIGQDVADEGPSVGLLSDFQDARTGDMVPLRLQHALHRRALDGAEPELARFFPSLGGDMPEPGDQDGWAQLRAAVVAAIAAHPTELRVLLDQIPQTNEPGRAAPLIGVLALASNAWSLPIRLHEIGCSAGLNLRADKFRVATQDGVGVGPLDSPVQLHNGWSGEVVPTADSPIDVVERVGVDLDPVNIADGQAQLYLKAFIWPDQVERFRRLSAAIDIALTVPATVTRSSAADHVESLALQPGNVLMVWHSAFWMYLSVAERARITNHLEMLGAHADESQPLVHVALEARDPNPASTYRGWVVVRSWPPLPHTGVDAGQEVRLGVAAPHGVPMVWENPLPLAADI